MQTEIETIDAAEPFIACHVFPSAINDLALCELREVTRLVGRKSDCLRKWLGDNVAHEFARRAAGDFELEEPAAWQLPWHKWNDDELRQALVASYSWYDVTAEPDATNVLREVHRAIVTACAARLGEIHAAIELARANPERR